MIFHFCKAGETLLSIAREYGISPVRLLEENALSDPDRLAVGQCLVIYRSARSYTVRGGDTLGDICRRFRTTAGELQKFNPAIGKKQLLYPGQTLSLGRAEASGGCLSVNGIVSVSVPLPKITAFASALTYITISIKSDSLRRGGELSKCTEIVSFSKRNGILPLALVPLSEVSDELLSSLMDIGFVGLLAEIDSGLQPLDSAIAHAKGSGLIVGLLGSVSVASQSEIADFIVPVPDDSGEGFSRLCTLLRRDADQNLYRIMPPLPSHAIEEYSTLSFSSSLPLYECAAFAYKRNAPIERDATDRPFIQYDKVVRGKAERCTLRFEDLASIKNGLTEIGESGMSGLTLDLESAPESICTLLHQSFDIIRAVGEKDGGRLPL